MLREVDIEADDALFKRYLERIPVVALDGEELFDFSSTTRSCGGSSRVDAP